MNIFSIEFNITIFQAIYWSFKKYRSDRKEELLTVIGWTIYGALTTLQLCYFLGLADNTFFALWGTIIGFFSLLTLLTISLLERTTELQDKTKQLELTTQDLKTIQNRLFHITSQVAHDIRSPLAALNVISLGSLELPEEERLILKTAIDRVNDIANTLAYKNFEKKVTNQTSGQGLLNTTLLFTLIEKVITEKRVQFRTKIGINIQTIYDQNSRSIFVYIDEIQLESIFSKMINNAVEAISINGQIRILVKKEQNFAVITIQDDGKGIPEEIIGKLGNRGVTFGKDEGSGLGLFHAKTHLLLGEGA